MSAWVSAEGGECVWKKAESLWLLLIMKCMVSTNIAVDAFEQHKITKEIIQTAVAEYDQV
jgi:hypothetical protein